MTTKRVTYATLSADNADLHAGYEAGLKTARGWLGRQVVPRIAGQRRDGGPPLAVRSPSDSSLVVCEVRPATATDIDAAADRISDRAYELAGP